MPSVYIRKILRSGDSKVVALPPAWLRYYNLNAGDEVEIISNEDIIIKAIKKVKEKMSDANGN